MTPIRFTATVPPDGTLKLDHLPPGRTVEVVVTETVVDPTEGGKYPLRGREPYRYDDPFGPAMDADDWEANQ